jgi:hypothetical protein
MMNSEAWINEISSAQFDSVFNPYADVCPIHDVADADRHRKVALLACLNSAIQTGVESIWIARDLGYRGGRRTGFALTDDIHLERHAARWSVDVVRPTKGTPVAEATASVVWKALERIDETVFLWNVFPLHPHDADDPMTNRTHTSVERDFGLSMLEGLLELLQPTRVMAIGGDAVRAANRLGYEPLPLRHPSYGGARIFANQVCELYNLDGDDGRGSLI